MVSSRGSFTTENDEASDSQRYCSSSLCFELTTTRSATVQYDNDILIQPNDKHTQYTVTEFTTLMTTIYALYTYPRMWSRSQHQTGQSNHSFLAGLEHHQALSGNRLFPTWLLYPNCLPSHFSSYQYQYHILLMNWHPCRPTRLTCTHKLWDTTSNTQIYHHQYSQMLSSR